MRGFEGCWKFLQGWEAWGGGRGLRGDLRGGGSRGRDAVSDQSLQGIDPAWMRVEAGDEGEFGTAGGEERFPTAHADFFEGFEAIGDEGGAENEKTAGSLLGEADQFVIGVGFKPRVTAESGLERDGVFLGRKSGSFDEATDGLEALMTVTGGVGRAGLGATIGRGEAMVSGGIGFAEVPFGDAVETEEQVVEGLLEEGLCGFDEGVEVSGMGVVGGGDLELEFGEVGPNFVAHLLNGGLEAGHGEMGEEWNESDALHALALEGVQRGGRGGILVAHAQLDRAGEAFLEKLADLVTGMNERGSLFCPDGLIRVGGLRGASGQDQAMDHQEPDGPRCIEDPAVHEEFAEVSADIGNGGAIG